MAEQEKKAVINKTAILHSKVYCMDTVQYTGDIYTSVQFDSEPTEEQVTKAKAVASGNFLRDLFTDKVQTLLLVSEGSVAALNKEHIVSCEITSVDIE